MTILTKPFSEKKDKLVVPLVHDDALNVETSAPSGDVESQNIHRRIIILPGHARRVSSSTILCLLIVALAVVSVGIIGGKILYNEYLSVTRRMHEPYERSEGWVRIPMNGNMDNEDWKRILSGKFFQENFEIDAANKYEKIDVPDFKNGRNGRFIHDFNTNYTGIIDVTGGRCFVMPLNRGNVLPPSSLFDLVHKMWDGYYKVDTKVVRETMRVVTPPVTDTTDIGQYIATECQSMPIYRLEKYVGGISKRSANPESEVKFGQFAGKGIWELDIVNLDDVLDYEKQYSGGHASQ
ncbi:integral membrane protein 2C isoform X2 [Euwallacea fornicatus]|uniref:integral membrane protein 2C isoform X2 n=1 Tax=Euwallacea fornicatus TaxID=995702 RepID=UPI00338E0471